LDADDLAGFKGIIKAKEHKKEFATRIYQWMNSNDAASQVLREMGAITSAGKLDMAVVEKLRAFVSGLTDARLKDVLSKNAVFAGKSIAHSQARATNKVLKDIEHEPEGKFGLMIKLYNYIRTKLDKYEDKDRAFKRMLDKIPLAHDPTGNPSEVGKGAYHLWKNFKGQQVDVESAIKDLNTHYNFPAGKEHRANKAAGRGEQIRQIGDI
jgi:hypothetical protein